MNAHADTWWFPFAIVIGGFAAGVVVVCCAVRLIGC
jgi:hypothetical protein